MRLSIDQFQRIYQVVSTTTDEIDRLTGVCAIIHGGKAEDYLKKTVSELAKYSVDISVPEGKALVSFNCQGKRFNVNHLVSTISAGDFIDLTAFTQTEQALVENMHEIMAIFCTHNPRWFGKKMTRVQVAKWLKSHCDISIAYPTAVFFFFALLEITETYRTLWNDGGNENTKESEKGNPRTLEQHYGWVVTLDRLTGGDRSNWDFYLNMNVIEFLNYLCYLKDKQKVAQLEMVKQKG